MRPKLWKGEWEVFMHTGNNLTPDQDSCNMNPKGSYTFLQLPVNLILKNLRCWALPSILCKIEANLYNISNFGNAHHCEFWFLTRIDRKWKKCVRASCKLLNAYLELLSRHTELQCLGYWSRRGKGKTQLHLRHIGWAQNPLSCSIQGKKCKTGLASYIFHNSPSCS